MDITTLTDAIIAAHVKHLQNGGFIQAADILHSLWEGLPTIRARRVSNRGECHTKVVEYLFKSGAKTVHSRDLTIALKPKNRAEQHNIYNILSYLKRHGIIDHIRYGQYRINAMRLKDHAITGNVLLGDPQ